MTRAARSLSLTICRGFQLLFSLVVLGITTSLIHGHRTGPLPTALAFAVIIGAVSLVGGVINVASSFLEFLHDQLTLVLDGIVVLLNVAGGILIAMKMKGVQCNVSDDNLIFFKRVPNDIICGGMRKLSDQIVYCYYALAERPGILNSRCRGITADAAFMLLTAVMIIGIATVVFMRMRNPYGN